MAYLLTKIPNNVFAATNFEITDNLKKEKLTRHLPKCLLRKTTERAGGLLVVHFLVHFLD